jgi:DNA primase
MHQAAQEYFRRMLNQPAGEVCRQYLRRRGMNADMVTGFGLGASPDDWQGLANFLKSRGYTPEQGVQAGLLSQNERGKIYDRFRARLIFPIQNLSGQVIAFGGRVVTEGEPKYLNSSDTPIYKKGEHLYGLFQARQAMTRSKRAILTEGYMDVLSLHQFGYKDACGVLGTALTQDQVKRLAGFCSRMDLIFDGDTAGRKAALRSAEMILQYGVACRVVLMPDGEDVDSLLQDGGRDRLDACFNLAEDGLDYCLRTVQEAYAPREIVGWANGFLSGSADNGLRAFYLPRVAKGLGMAEADLRRFRPGPGQAGQGGQGGQPMRVAKAPQEIGRAHV